MAELSPSSSSFLAALKAPGAPWHVLKCSFGAKGVLAEGIWVQSWRVLGTPGDHWWIVNIWKPGAHKPGVAVRCSGLFLDPETGLALLDVLLQTREPEKT